MMACNLCEDRQKKLNELEKKVEDLEKRVKELEEMLDTICAYAQTIARNAAHEMSAGNLPRGRYAYLKACLEVGNQVLRIAGRTPIPLKKRHKGILGIGPDLFKGLFGG
jgi:cell division septum initiation protein DivIVA